MIDSLARLCERTGTMPGTASAEGDGAEKYLVLTLHRPSNVDDPEALRALMGAIEEGAGDTPIRFPVHPRTEAALRRSGDYDRITASGQWQLLGPAGYSEFIAMVRGALGVVTDSGGIQEETTWLGIPCLTLRESTERPSTVELGTNQLVGVEPAAVREAIARLHCPPPPAPAWFRLSGMDVPPNVSRASSCSSFSRLYNLNSSDVRFPILLRTAVLCHTLRGLDVGAPRALCAARGDYPRHQRW
jgi:hypothetical protein